MSGSSIWSRCDRVELPSRAMMRPALALLVLAACHAQPPAQPAPPPASGEPAVEAPPPAPPPPAPAPPALHGVYTEDIDRSVEACADFYEFANGAWRKANPIPA